MIHMLKDSNKDTKIVTTRCRSAIKLPAGQALPDIGVTGFESRVTCPECTLPERNT